MKKVIGSICLFFITVCFWQCGSNEIVYSFAEKRFVFETDSVEYGTKYIQQASSASFLTYEFKPSKGPLQIYVRFNGLMPWINSIENIDLVLFQKNEKGELVKIEAKELKEFKAEYSNGQTIVMTPLKNEHISDQVNFKEADWGEYTKNSNINFVGTFVYDLEKYPDQLLMKFKIKWKEKEKEFETTMTRAEYKGPKFNPKY